MWVIMLLMHSRSTAAVSLKLVTNRRPTTGFSGAFLDVKQTSHLSVICLSVLNTSLSFVPAAFNRFYSLLMHDQTVGEAYLITSFDLLYLHFSQLTEVLNTQI